MTDIYTKAMFGQHAVHSPMWIVIQDQGDTIAFAGASRDQAARYGSAMTHQLIIGEFVIRPHVVVESDAFKGTGLTGMLQTGLSIEDWIKSGNLLLDPMNQHPK